MRGPAYNPLVEGCTTIAIQRFLDDLANLPGDAPAEPVVRALLAHAVARLHMLCTTMLHGKYPRLARPPLNLQSDEMLGAVVERLIKAMRQVRPGNVRQFFAIASQHMRWELNELARQLDERTPPMAVNDALPPAVTVMFDGSVETVGAKSTVNLAEVVVALRLAALLKMASYS